MKHLEVCQFIEDKVTGKYLVITSRDLDKQSGTFKYFNDFHDAYKWVHDTSLAQFPKWHKENCSVCKEPK